MELAWCTNVNPYPDKSGESQQFSEGLKVLDFL